ncbi:MAG: nitroreductase [Methanomicrobiaceae archaeon]|nr:nitroreductase [Methanomicrobiaceae archaeon]
MNAENGVIDAILNRRSVRNFSNKAVPDDVIEKLIDAGIHAPSALGLYPWSFVIVKNQNMMKRISDFAKPIVIEGLKKSKGGGMTQRYLEMTGEEGFSIFYNAPCLLLVLGRNNAAFADIDCSLCAQNIMLAAHSLGLATCWIGSARYLEKDSGLVSALGIPDGYHLVAPLILGYPDVAPEMPGRTEPGIVWVK